MALSTIAFLFLLGIFLLGSILITPMMGLMAYLAIYNISPMAKWWGISLWHLGIRDSLFITIALMLGFFIHRSKMDTGLLQLDRQEILLIFFILLVWLSTIIGIDLGGDNYNIIKITKVTIVLLFASHIVTSIKRFDMIMWVLIICNIYMGINAFWAEEWMFWQGRLDAGIGGVDFAESNFLGAHMVFLIPITGVMFLRSKKLGKILCLINGPLIINTLTLLRSRGSFLAVVIILIPTFLFLNRNYRIYIIIGAILASVGFLSLTDQLFWNRISTISESQEERDTSASGRLLLWGIAVKMANDYPLGIGADNYKRLIEKYAPEAEGTDTHSTYFKCLAEIGFHGLLILFLLIFNAYHTLFAIRKKYMGSDTFYDMYAFGLIVGLTGYLFSGLFISMIYVEEFYWVLMLPIFLKRAIIFDTMKQEQTV